MLKVLDELCTPKRGTKYSAYVDLFAREDVVINSGETKIIKLGVKLDLDKLYKSWYFYTEQNNISGSWDMYLKSHYLEIALRSSLGAKGLIISNGIGIIDLDYPDEIGLIVTNSNNYNFFVTKGDKVAQCTLKEHKGYLMGYESDVVRVSGFGSTGER